MWYPSPNAESLLNSRSETARYRHLTQKYCWLPNGFPGCGVDIASQGDSVVPWAIGLDLPVTEFMVYCSNESPKGPIQIRGHADHLPFEADSLDFVYASHIIEDFEDWNPILDEWTRVLHPGGYLIILVPDKARWAIALENGQTPNCAHRHESFVGELSACCERFGLKAIEDRLTDQFPGDYTILFVGIKM